MDITNWSTLHWYTNNDLNTVTRNGDGYAEGDRVGAGLCRIDDPMAVTRRAQRRIADFRSNAGYSGVVLRWAARNWGIVVVLYVFDARRHNTRPVLGTVAPRFHLCGDSCNGNKVSQCKLLACSDFQLVSKLQIKFI